MTNIKQNLVVYSYVAENILKQLNQSWHNSKLKWINTTNVLMKMFPIKFYTAVRMPKNPYRCLEDVCSEISAFALCSHQKQVAVVGFHF